LLLVDVFSRGLTGKQAEKVLEKAGMTVNKNTIPYVNSPRVTSNRPHPIPEGALV